MVERFLKQTTFSSVEDYNRNLEFIIPDNFNFAYDVMDVWASEQPDKLAMLWTSERGEELRFTFADLKAQTDRTAAYFQSLGIGKGDPVMLILKRHYQWWLSMLALHKLGAVAIPATHMLTKKDIVYRNTRASVKAIVCVNDEYVTSQILAALPDSPSCKVLVAVNSDAEASKPVPEGFHNWTEEWPNAPEFVRPEQVNTNDDTMLMYFTSGTSGEPKMVAHDYLYALLPEQRCSSTTTRSSLPRRYSDRLSATASHRSAHRPPSTASSYARTSRATTSPRCATAARLAKR